jgi:hypothetical protein
MNGLFRGVNVTGGGGISLGFKVVCGNGSKKTSLAAKQDVVKQISANNFFILK